MTISSPFHLYKNNTVRKWIEKKEKLETLLEKNADSKPQQPFSFHIIVFILYSFTFDKIQFISYSRT